MAQQPKTNAQTMSLPDLYQSLKHNNPQWQAIQHRHTSQQHTISQLGSVILPQVGLQAGFQYTYLDSDTTQFPSLSNNQYNSLNTCLRTEGSFNTCLINVSINACQNDPACVLAESGENQKFSNRSLGVSMTQPIFDKAKWAQYRSIASRIVQNDAQLQAARMDLLLQLCKDYFNALQAKESYELSQTSATSTQRQVKVIEKSFERGLVDAEQVFYLRALHSLELTKVQSAESTAAAALAQLRTSSSQPGLRLTAMTQDIPMQSPLPATVEAWQAIALKMNPESHLAKTQVDITRHEMDQQQSASLPTIALVAGINTTNSGGSASVFSPAGSSNTASIGLELQMPLYTGGNLSNSQAASRYKNQQAIQEARAQENQLKAQVAGSFNRTQSILEQSNTLKITLQAMASRVQQLEKGFERGTYQASEVLQARQDLLEAQKQYAQARYQYSLSSIELKRLAGVLTLEDLNIIASWIQPETSIQSETTTPSKQAPLTQPENKPAIKVLPMKQPPAGEPQPLKLFDNMSPWMRY